MKRLLFIIMFILSCTFENKTMQNDGIIYNWKILYTYQGLEKNNEDKYRKMILDDSLYFFVEDLFLNDILELKYKNTVILNEKVSTELSTGLSHVFVLKNNMNNISIRLNNSNWCNIDLIRPDYNLIGIEKDSDLVTIFFYKSVPRYY